jgi:hypothetical protein
VAGCLAARHLGWDAFGYLVCSCSGHAEYIRVQGSSVWPLHVPFANGQTSMCTSASVPSDAPPSPALAHTIPFPEHMHVCPAHACMCACVSSTRMHACPAHAQRVTPRRAGAPAPRLPRRPRRSETARRATAKPPPPVPSPSLPLPPPSLPY